MSFLVLEGLQKTYGDGTLAVRGIDFGVRTNAVVDYSWSRWRREDAKTVANFGVFRLVEEIQSVNRLPR